MTDSIETAIQDLRTEFPPHPLDTSDMFAEWGGSYLDASSFRAGAQGKRWDELSPHFLELHHDAMLFLGPAAVVEVIPAYLIAAMRGGPDLDMLPNFAIGVLTRADERERFDARFGTLPSTRKRAIARALEAWEMSLQGSHNQPPVSADSYWRTFRRV
jgi:hypothetical protein